MLESPALSGTNSIIKRRRDLVLRLLESTSNNRTFSKDSKISNCDNRSGKAVGKEIYEIVVNFTDFSKVDICNALAFGVLLAEDEDGDRKGKPKFSKKCPKIL